ncbi:hypothetical protein [Microvirga pakistanensis]|uniref:hypothetical protein n=1 Tax=Microvirga pakistanensis TaxID=1682650 RepID=UPI001FCED39C|nr:hypothetical protein [Microvirga pakistanensis]
MLSYDFGFYLVLGFVAQLIDGALGMAYGLIATSALLASGASPAPASMPPSVSPPGWPVRPMRGTATWIGGWSCGWLRLAWRVGSSEPSS